jgi:hypothetical protein
LVSMPTDFVSTNQKEIDDILTINMYATLCMTSTSITRNDARYTFIASGVMIVLIFYTWMQETRSEASSSIWGNSLVLSLRLCLNLLWIKSLPVNVHRCSHEDNIVVKHVNTFYVVYIFFLIQSILLTHLLCHIRCPNVQDPQSISARPSLINACLICPLESWSHMWDGFQQLSRHIYTDLVSCASRLRAEYAMALVGWKGLFIRYIHHLHKIIKNKAQ